jgi:hypothetical protein
MIELADPARYLWMLLLLLLGALLSVDDGAARHDGTGGEAVRGSAKL